MKRREFLRTLGLSGLSVAGATVVRPSGLHAAPDAPARKPNILFILTDQQHAGAIAALGNPHLKTPHMDSLVASGTTFDKSYCPNPVCMPCRSALLTGLMPTEAGVYVNTTHQNSGGKIDRDLPSLGDWFAKEGGYQCVYAGKYHLPQSNTYNVRGFEVLAAGYGHRGSPTDSTVARACEAWLLNRPANETKPFLMVCSLVNPHDICHWLSINTKSADRAKRYPNLAKLTDLPPLPKNFSPPDLGESKQQIAIRTKQQPTNGKWNEQDWRYYLWSYYRQVEMVDAEIGRVLAALRESGAENDTLVVLTSDHGEGMAEHQMVRKGFLYDSAARVPLVFRVPGQTTAKHNTSAIVSGIDLFPTLCAQAGIPAPDNLTHARDISAAIQDPSAVIDRDCIVIEENEAALPSKGVNPPTLAGAGRAVRSARFKFITYDGSTNEQLFDLVADPGETTNLAIDPKFQTDLDAHRAMLTSWENGLKLSPNVPASPWVTKT
ncbi:MAG: sulfatase-like hydrolase/transferase [Terrimicrobiaceae bacterium]